jgi:nucleoside-diphosphate-sugar epimerase
MKCLVTGAAGFIGSNLCEELLKQGHEVIAIDNLNAGKLQNLNDCMKYPQFKFHQIDILYKEMKDLFVGVDYVFHEAASKKTICLRNPQMDLLINGAGTLMMLQLAMKNNVKKIIHASTGSVYGEGKIFPQTEDHPLNPCSYYGVSKLAGEKYVALFNKMGLNTTILRYFHVYGAKQDDSYKGGVIAIWLKAIFTGTTLFIHGNGDQMRSFTYVKDVVDANIAAMTKGDGEVYNCASGIKVTLNELIAKLKLRYKFSVTKDDPMEGDIYKFEIDNNKIIKDLNINFTDFNTGLDATIRYYQSLYSKV